MYDSILVPTDGSAVAERAGEYGCSLAERFDAVLHAVHVDEEPTLIGSDDEPSGESAVDAIAELATERDVDVTTAVRDGDDSVHREILDHADASDADAIVMGTHGRSGAQRLIIGSVAEKVVRRSPVPVVTVRPST